MTPKLQKTTLIQKIKELEGLSQDDRAYLLNLVNTKKKYGLVWEDKPEEVEEQLRENLPVLREVVERRIIGAELPADEPKTPTGGDQLTLGAEEEPDTAQPTDNPNHILIEGDNLHALTALTFTHEGKIDVIYIDPPYNTGNKDFKYNDSFVDKEDSYRHSKWLSFMHKRLVIAKRLLNDEGVIFISIDDNEQAQLKMLCDDVFGEANFVDNIIWEKVFAPKNDAKYFSASHDFIVVVAKNKSNWKRNLLPRTELQDSRYSNPDNDPRGPWTSGDCSVKTYSASTDYPITTPSGRIVNPPRGYCWRFSERKFEELISEKRIWFGKNGQNVPRYKRFLKDVQQGTVPITIWKKEEVGHNQDAKQEMNNVLNDVNNVFDTPKPIKLIKRILQLTSNADNNFSILDFFAGSGTTLHATMQLNQEDGGNRQCIMVTNNENNICEEVTYERNKRVIEGYTNSRGAFVKGLKNNNLRYYKTDFVSSQRTEQNKRLLTEACTEILCIKEDCYTELSEDYGLNSREARLFTNEKGKFLLVMFHSRNQWEVAQNIITLIQQIGTEQNPVAFYAFGSEKENLVEDFLEVEELIEVVPLPGAILNAYKSVFREIGLDKKEPVPKDFFRTEEQETDQLELNVEEE